MTITWLSVATHLLAAAVGFSIVYVCHLVTYLRNRRYEQARLDSLITDL